MDMFHITGEARIKRPHLIFEKKNYFNNFLASSLRSSLTRLEAMINLNASSSAFAEMIALALLIRFSQLFSVYPS